MIYETENEVENEAVTKLYATTVSEAKILCSLSPCTDTACFDRAVDEHFRTLGEGTCIRWGAIDKFKVFLLINKYKEKEL